MICWKNSLIPVALVPTSSTDLRFLKKNNNLMKHKPPFTSSYFAIDYKPTKDIKSKTQLWLILVYKLQNS